MQINPYLFYNGNCQEAFEFYAKVFGGTIEAMFPHKGTPAESNVPAEWAEKIMHAKLRIGDQFLMASDAPPPHFHQPQGFSVSVNIKDPADADRIFAALSEDARITMPIQETFWAQRFGMLVDRYDIPWMINCEKAPH